jgi:hypothetical protein
MIPDLSMDNDEEKEMQVKVPELKETIQENKT